MYLSDFNFFPSIPLMEVLNGEGKRRLLGFLRLRFVMASPNTAYLLSRGSNYQCLGYAAEVFHHYLFAFKGLSTDLVGWRYTAISLLIP